jgi:ABC-type histidine transport system ATPase subunit
MDFARSVSDRVIFLHQGRIEEEGTPEEVFNATRSARLRQFLNAASHEQATSEQALQPE